jgi:hypothetical protein
MQHILAAGDRAEDPAAVHLQVPAARLDEPADPSRSPALASNRPVMIVSFRHRTPAVHAAYIDPVRGGN